MPNVIVAVAYLILVCHYGFEAYHQAKGAITAEDHDDSK